MLYYILKHIKKTVVSPGMLIVLVATLYLDNVKLNHEVEYGFNRIESKRKDIVRSIIFVKNVALDAKKTAERPMPILPGVEHFEPMSKR